MTRNKAKDRTKTEPGAKFSIDPFSNLEIPKNLTLKDHKPEAAEEIQAKKEMPTPILYIRIAKKGRAGKSVTLISGFTKFCQDEFEELARKIRKELGTGGTSYEDTIELQGDQRQKAAKLLGEKGFKLKGEIDKSMK